MTNRRQFELLLVRLVPHALRDDFITVGVVLVEAADGGGESAFADVRFTRDWKRVECFAPEIEVEMLERLEAEVRGRLKDVRRREDLLQLLDTQFGTLFDVGPAKAVVAEDPAAEMRVLEEMYLARGGAGMPATHGRRMGRMGIVSRMQDAFAQAGVLDLLLRDIEMKEFTGEHDPFRVDFGFRVGKSLQMFYGLALNLSRDPAVTLAYRYTKIQAGMRARDEEALMTAIVSEEAARAKGEVASGLAMLRASEIEVRSVGEMGEIAERVRRGEVRS
jgi:hypothetical protein